MGTNLGKCEWVWEEKLRWLIPRWPNSWWQNSRWLPSSSWMWMNEFESDWISLSQSQSGGRVFWVNQRGKISVWFQHGRSWIQDGRFHDGHHHQVEWEWMSLSQIELVWIRVRVKGECFWVNLREENKVFWIQHCSVWIWDGRIQDGCHHQVQWEWMSLSQFELVGVRVRVEWECFWVNLREENKVSEFQNAELIPR